MLHDARVPRRAQWPTASALAHLGVWLRHLGDNTLDGGASELPVQAIIDPVTVLEGFAACPNITVAWRDGRSAKLILDPNSVVPVRGALRLPGVGFTVDWQSPDGKTGSALLSTNCLAAITGLAPGRTTTSLRVTNAAGVSAIIGTVAVEVVPAAAATGGALYARTRGPETLPQLALESALAVGEERSLDLTPGLQFSPPGAPAGLSLLPIPEALTLTSSDESVVSVSAMRVRGVAAGSATLSAEYRFGGRLLVLGPLSLTVTNATATRLVFGLPVDDQGLLLEDVHRTLEWLEVGQCFNTAVWGVVETPTSLALRRLDQVAAVSLIGSGLSRTTADGFRFCATAEGDGAVRACHAGRCSLLSTVVVAPRSNFPTVEATVTPTSVRTGVHGLQRVCLALRVTARWGTAAAVDVTSSPALRYRPFFDGSITALSPVEDSSTGLVEREQERTCFSVDVLAGQPDSGFRVGYAGGWSSVRLRISF